MRRLVQAVKNVLFPATSGGYATRESPQISITLLTQLAGHLPPRNQVSKLPHGMSGNKIKKKVNACKI